MAKIPTQTGRAGIELIKQFEGLSLEKYLDAVGLWTIGYGHLIKPNECFERPLTYDEAQNLLCQDLRQCENAINALVTVDLNQNQFDALVSFAFNLGTGNLKSSTLLRKLNQGDYLAAADEFLRWNRAGGKVLTGLTRRRTAERELFKQHCNEMSH